VADDVKRVRVTEDEVAAAKLEIRLLDRLGRPVDPRLRVIAAAKPAQSPPSGFVASAEVAAWKERLQSAWLAAGASTPRDKPPLSSLRAHRNRALRLSDIAQLFPAGEVPSKKLLEGIAAYLPPQWGGMVDATSFALACRNWAATLDADSDEADEEDAEQSLGK
jgi:hypothetical protein